MDDSWAVDLKVRGLGRLGGFPSPLYNSFALSHNQELCRLPEGFAMPDYLKSPTCWLLLCGSFILTAFLTPLVIVFARRMGVIDGGGFRKIHSRQVPLLGGLAIAIPFIGVCLLGLSGSRLSGMFAQISGRQTDFLLLVVCGLAITALGAFDDARGLRARHKFAVQILIALAFCLSGRSIQAVQLPLFGSIHMGPLVGSLVTIVWIVGVINAINLVDGIDGLATGLSLISTLGLAAIAIINGHTFTVLLCLTLAGSLLAFLGYNYNPARIFLGDAGSMFLGFMMATLSLMGASRAGGTVMLLAPVLALGFPIFDTITSMLRRILRGRSPFIGDRSHTHHRLLDYGYSQRQVALILYAIALMCVLSAVICQVVYPRDILPLFAVGLYALVVVFVAWINGYLRLRHIFRVSMCRKRNSKFDAFSKWASMALNDNEQINIEDIFRAGCKDLNLRFLEIAYLDPPEVILSFRAKAERRDYLIACDPVESTVVNDADLTPLRIRYQLDHVYDLAMLADENIREADKLEHQDVVACLAHLFSRIRIAQIDNHPKVAEISGNDPELAEA